jgi:archaemetzincin
MERPDGRPRLPGPVALWWIGEAAIDAELVKTVGHLVAREFACEVVVDAPAERPERTLDAKRGQHSSRELLKWLIARAPERAARVLGLTDVDLFIPVLTFVFGEAQLEGKAAVVSVARLAAANDRRLTASRLGREAVHELGHTFGLVHCDALEEENGRAAPCVMARSPSVRAVDAKGTRLCPACRARFVTFQQDGSHVYREHENPHR